MFDFGDDIILDGYRIPWLIWIQIFIMFLLTLTILLSYFGFFAIDNTDSLQLISSPHLGSPSNCSQNTQVCGNRDVEEVDTTTVSRTSGMENNAEREGSPLKSLASAPNTERAYHPCCYFDLAKQAFLKCLGLGSSSRSPNSPDKEHEHQD
ncbi:hypothetical protein RND81_13G206700 [Saponaria officinalis]|uniref:Uncharacterized protein n=1 Tax=Saponaria officinalis TaxID=3572 RepID=A0AAW1H3C8_SAPOF